eukprot:COSAG01_NODE_788_length_13597_cov_35.303601_7_plen_74_part_00
MVRPPVHRSPLTPYSRQLVRPAQLNASLRPCVPAAEEAAAAMGEIMAGSATDAQVRGEAALFWGGHHHAPCPL